MDGKNRPTERRLAMQYPDGALSVFEPGKTLQAAVQECLNSCTLPDDWRKVVKVTVAVDKVLFDPADVSG
ncbi:MAG TPA: hypothetical protein VF748_07530 [Candidatus Acidoferrum sp.]